MTESMATKSAVGGFRKLKKSFKLKKQFLKILQIFFRTMKL